MNKVVPRNGSSFFGFGVAQHNRAPKSLDPDFVKLDDRTLPELLAYSAELSKYIKYYNLKDVEDGTWEPFFLSDISVIIALIISTDLKSIDDQSNKIINTFYRSQQLKEKSEKFLELYNLSLTLVENFNTWHQQIVELNLDEKRFESQIEFELYNIIIDKVRPHFHRLSSFKHFGLKLKSLADLDKVSFEHLNTVWETDFHIEEEVFFGKTELEKITAGMLSLRLQYRFLFQALSFTVNHFKRFFNNSLKFKDNHNPDIALYISFLKVFSSVQQDYSNIAERLQAFYYRKILNLNPLLGESDHAHVMFTLADNIDRYTLPKGTQLTAGLNENSQEIVFETISPIEITKAEIKKIKTVYCSRLDDLDTSNYQLTSHIYSADVANSVDGLGKFQEMKFSWPIFGEEQEYKASEESNMQLADIGWAFSSPVLHLKEGNRKVTIRLDFEKESTRIFKRLVYDIYLKVNSDRKANEPAKVLTEIFYDRIFNQVDKARNFKIFLTSSKQWFEVDPNTIFVKAVGDGDWVFDTELADEENMGILNALEISFTLPNAAPPVTGFKADVLGGLKFDTPDPIIKFLLNDKKQPYVYSFLQSLEVTKINIAVEVDRVRDLSVVDELEGVSENKNIFPFGTEPNRGTSCYIGNPELFRKHLTEVTFNLEWDRIPETVGDFLKHYEAYENPLNPAEVKIQFGAISNYEIEMEFDESLEFPLFTTTEGNPEIIDVTPLDTSTYLLDEDQLALLNILPNYDLPDNNPYSDNIETGYFVIELTEPRNALYNNIYQNEVQQALNKNVENPEELKKFPKPPVTPFIKSLELSYKAESEWNVKHGDGNKPEMIFHIHPFGQETVYAGGSAYNSNLLPKYNEDGYLFLGLENVKAPETISMYFELTSEDTSEQTLKTVPKITWMYLTENRWIPFDDSKVIFDTTYGFTESGIVRLQLPLSITKNNSILDNEYFWIGAKILGDVNKLCKAIDIHTNAVETRWVFDEKLNDRLHTKILPKSLRSLVHSVSEIKSIAQPYSSFGGRTPEDIKAFNTRVSELIRHKNRIITHWDIERIALEQYPSIFQAKALSYLSNPIDADNEKEKKYVFADEGENEENHGINHKDGIKLVLIPKQIANEKRKTPKFSLHRLLSMQAGLAEVVPPFMNIQVVNPQYEYVRVVANVKFIDNFNNGQTLNRLFEDINAYIAPWLYKDSEDVKIGGSISENVLQNFIKGLEYVKFLTKFSLLHIVEEDGVFKLQDTAMEQDIVSIITARPWGVLLPDDLHEIDMVEFEEEELPQPRVNSDQIIRFQNKVNILGDKKYIKVKNQKFEDSSRSYKTNSASNFTISI